ncbi:MAG TPA: zinc-dependent alcohol dehydrogenase family protein [Atribacteraceae bacterium]|nr:zinc-dependent alcohol dehydrogenase family protein [Atribacteraceae bacterium]
MKALVYHRAGEYEITERPMPRPDELSVLMKVHSCGLCGTDIHVHQGDWAVNFPRITGHEFSGTIVEVGKEVTHLKEGDRAVVDPNLGCGTCAYCRNGRFHLCKNALSVSTTIDGGFAEYCRLPGNAVYRVPDDLALERAAFAEPVACAVHGIDRARIRVGDRVVIIGGGPMGLILSQLAQKAGAGLVIVIEPVALRREAALDLGANRTIDPGGPEWRTEIMDLTNGGGDVVIENVGLAGTMQDSLDLVKSGGTVLWFGVTDPKISIPVRPYFIFHEEISLLGSFVNPHTHQRAIDLLTGDLVRVTPLITHRFPLVDFAQALETYRHPSRIKIMVHM